MLTFDQFKSKLEDECIVAINLHGYKITNYVRDREKTCCPLGAKCVVVFGNRYTLLPHAHMASLYWQIQFEEANAFICGFENHCVFVNKFGKENQKYFDLGKVYRKKFITNAPNV